MTEKTTLSPLTMARTEYGWLMILMALSLISHLAITVNHFLSLSNSSCSMSLPRSFISLMMSLQHIPESVERQRPALSLLHFLMAEIDEMQICTLEHLHNRIHLCGVHLDFIRCNHVINPF